MYFPNHSVADTVKTKTEVQNEENSDQK